MLLIVVERKLFVSGHDGCGRRREGGAAWDCGNVSNVLEIIPPDTFPLCKHAAIAKLFNGITVFFLHISATNHYTEF